MVPEAVVRFLSGYGGRPVKIMEVCGTHTATALRGGIRSLISDKIRLVSGPGCPVCLASSAYIDRLCALAKDGCVIVSFGDLLKVKGSTGSLLDMKAAGHGVEMVYSPLDAVRIASERPGKTVVLAAIGFETTAPAHALVVETAIQKGVKNLMLLTAMKRLMPALDLLCADPGLDAFIAPGHVAAVTGSAVFEPAAKKHKKPFAVAGFTPESMLLAMYCLVKQIGAGGSGVANLYGEAVRPEGNEKARAVMDKYFEPGDAYWRGLGVIKDSGLYLKKEYMRFDAGSFGRNDEGAEARGCMCGAVLTGRSDPDECPMFGKKCTPEDAYGPCMVSAEGACGIWYREGAAK